MPRISTLALAIVAIALSLIALPVPAQEAEAGNLVLVLDASGSMWGQIDGESKIVIARRVLKELAGELPDASRVALVAYGHRREGDCADVETVVPLGPLDRAGLGSTIDALNPKGKTPITASLEAAVDVVEGIDGATVILVSDGLETCGGDPCATVRKARQSGVKFVLHVVGFDVGEVEVAELECAAQAGGGLYFDARSADELAEALDRAVAAPPELPAGMVVVHALQNGEPVDAAVRVFPAGGGEVVTLGRTYTGPDTNPRRLPVEDGVYDVEVKAVAIKGNPVRRFPGIEIRDGGTVERTADFTTGELAIGATRNGAISDATVRIYAAGTTTEVAAGRTYLNPARNPKAFTLTAGEYDVLIGSVEIEGAPKTRLEGLVVEGGERSEHVHDFKSGDLRIGIFKGGERVEAVVRVYHAEGGQAAIGRSSLDERKNPLGFVLEPGAYRAIVKPLKLEDATEKEIEVTIAAGGEVEETVEF